PHARDSGTRQRVGANARRRRWRNISHGIARELLMPSVIPYRFIVVEGPSGVGKTSLARRLGQSLGGQLVLEQADQNPFLERFYKNPRAAAFQTQLFFLFQRARQLEEGAQGECFAA